MNEQMVNKICKDCGEILTKKDVEYFENRCEECEKAAFNAILNASFMEYL